MWKRGKGLVNHKFSVNQRYGMLAKKGNPNLGSIHENIISGLRKFVEDYYFQFCSVSDEYWQNGATRIAKNLEFPKLRAAHGIANVKHSEGTILRGGKDWLQCNREEILLTGWLVQTRCRVIISLDLDFWLEIYERLSCGSKATLNKNFSRR